MVAPMTRTFSDAEISPVFARAEARRPRVRQPNSPWTMVLGIGGAAVLGLVAFTSLSNGRIAHAQAATLRPGSMQATGRDRLRGPVRLAQADIPPASTPAPPSATPPITAQAPLPANPDPSEAHWRAPAVVVDLTDGSAGAARLAQATAVAPAGSPPEDVRQNAEERFAARVSNATVDTARAAQMRDLTRVIPQGFVIPAILETAIDSDLPGSVRAVVSRDVRGFDGAQVLIPRGSKLIGQYRSAVAVGQTRAFIVWSRLITPQGVTVEVGSPATDQLGRGGLAGKADTHFFERFGASILLSVISAGVEAAAHSGSNNTSLVIGSATQANQVASIALQKQIDIPTTIRVPQGAPVQVSVARDLDFSTVAPVR
jgi:type IV secretory pathway VirB10-like protein